MSDTHDELQREMVQLLRQAVQELQKGREYREAVAQSITRDLPDQKKSREEHEQRMAEMKKEGEQRRKEEVEYRNRLFATLDRLIEVLSQISTKLHHPDSPSG